MSNDEMPDEVREQFEQARANPRKFLSDITQMVGHALEAGAAMTIVVRAVPSVRPLNASMVSANFAMNPALGTPAGLELIEFGLGEILKQVKEMRARQGRGG